MAEQNDYAGRAALTICEALLLSIKEHKLLTDEEVLGVLEDAAAAHQNVPDTDEDKEIHLRVADLINRIINGGNSIRWK